VELTPDAIDLPSFRHPARAAYILGPEGGSLSPEMIAKCEFTVKIPMSFCINVAMAGAIVMYDRMRSMGRFAERMEKPEEALVFYLSAEKGFQAMETPVPDALENVQRRMKALGEPTTP